MCFCGIVECGTNERSVGIRLVLLSQEPNSVFMVTPHSSQHGGSVCGRVVFPRPTRSFRDLSFEAFHVLNQPVWQAYR